MAKKTIGPEKDHQPPPELPQAMVDAWVVVLIDLLEKQERGEIDDDGETIQGEKTT